MIGACALPLTLMQIQPLLGLTEMLSKRDALYLKTHFSRVMASETNWNVGGLLIFPHPGCRARVRRWPGSYGLSGRFVRDYFTLVEAKIDESAWDAVLAKYRIDAVVWVKAHEQLEGRIRGGITEPLRQTMTRHHVFCAANAT